MNKFINAIAAIPQRLEPAADTQRALEKALAIVNIGISETLAAVKGTKTAVQLKAQYLLRQELLNALSLYKEQP